MEKIDIYVGDINYRELKSKKENLFLIRNSKDVRECLKRKQKGFFHGETKEIAMEYFTNSLGINKDELENINFISKINKDK